MQLALAPGLAGVKIVLKRHVLFHLCLLKRWNFLLVFLHLITVKYRNPQRFLLIQKWLLRVVYGSFSPFLPLWFVDINTLIRTPALHEVLDGRVGHLDQVLIIFLFSLDQIEVLDRRKLRNLNLLKQRYRREGRAPKLADLLSLGRHLWIQRPCYYVFPVEVGTSYRVRGTRVFLIGVLPLVRDTRVATAINRQ